MVNTKEEFSMGRRWLIFSSVFLVAVLASICMFKAPPMFSTNFTTDLGFDNVSIGWVMSMFAVIGVIIAFPAGGILAKLGSRVCLIITAASFVLGSGLGAIAQDSTIMLVSRFIEGLGMGLISVVGPAAVAETIPPRKQGLAMGIFGIWFAAGVVLAFNLAPAFAGIFSSWRAAWWAACILAVVALVFVIAVFRQVPAASSHKHEEAAEGAHAHAHKAPKADFFSIIMVGLAFCAWNIVNAGAISGFYPDFLTTIHHMDTQMAGTVASVTNILVLILGPVSGFVADKFNIHKGFIVFALACAAVLLLFGFGPNLALVWVFLIIMGFASASASTGVFSTVPILAKDPAKIGLGMAIVAFLQNIGIMVGSAAFPVVREALSGNYNEASLYFCVPICVVGAICALLIRRGSKKKS
jgi:predicted MFS family arabinose efflux permease